MDDNNERRVDFTLHTERVLKEMTAQIADRLVEIQEEIQSQDHSAAQFNPRDVISTTSNFRSDPTQYTMREELNEHSGLGQVLLRMMIAQERIADSLDKLCENKKRKHE